MSRVVLATDLRGVLRAIGPVELDQSVADLKAELKAIGWVTHGVAWVQSAAVFRADATGGTADRS